MAFPECKVYCDGSSYIAIPHTEGRKGKRPKRYEPTIEVKENEVKVKEEKDADSVEATIDNITETVSETVTEQTPEGTGQPVPVLPVINGEAEQAQSLNVRCMTRKELFEELYKANLGKKKSERKSIISNAMAQYFQSEEELKMYIDAQFSRKTRNMICRRVRLVRKLNLHSFNFFCTFTYDDKKHTEQTFRKKLMQCLWNMTKRKDWQYAGVWERSPEKHRLHFHGIFDIPAGTMPGEVIEVKDFSPIKEMVQVTHQNTYFNEKFGRSDFKEIPDQSVLGESMQYLVKYIEKTGEKIVYSKGLPQFFISDIMDEDILCPYGEEEQKLLLFDDFGCWDEGCYMGKVSPEVIKKMRKKN